MSTIESILLDHDVYSLDMELELLRCFENTRKEVNSRRIEHAIERSKVSYAGEYHIGNLPTIESILSAHGANVEALQLDLHNFFNRTLSSYKYLGFAQVIIPSQIVRLENQQATKRSPMKNIADQSEITFTQLLRESA